MKINFVRSGGFAGVRLSLELDTDSLPAEEASRLVRLVEACGFFDAQPDRSAVAAAPDRFEYRVSIDSQVWGRQDLVMAESEVPDDMRPLLEHLTALAMHRDAPGS